MSAHFTPAERDQLEQELLELHFGCHENPTALQARLAVEPELRALQAEVVQQAELLRAAAQPAVPALRLSRPKPTARRPWYTRPLPRLGAFAAAAALVALAVLVNSAVDDWRLAAAEHAQLSITVSAPRAVPAATPWSFTVQSADLRGEAIACQVHWRALDAADRLLAEGDRDTNGSTTIAMPASMLVPHRLAVTATKGDQRVEQSLELLSVPAAPLVHATTDKPVYRPGEPVFVRAVVLDRVTLAAQATAPQEVALRLRVLDPKGAAVMSAQDISVQRDPVRGQVGAFAWAVPEGATGGQYRLEVSSAGGLFPPEVVPFVVRSYQPPRLSKTLVLDRKTYAPGESGGAELKVERLAGGVPVGAPVRASLVLDGDEVWSQDAALDAAGRALFTFAVPKTVKAGAARFLARVTDGGVIESEIKPFVVPTGAVEVACFPEGGALIAGVSNRVYLEVTDPLGRPIDTAGAIVDGAGQVVAPFRTEHQGRGRCEFTPLAGARYVARAEGRPATFALPAVQERGIALQLLGDDVAANAPLRLRLAGSGDGPWLVGVFCRGVLLAQSTLRPDARGAVAEDVALSLPAEGCGVLRVTVFDHQLRPVAERLVQRASARRLQVELSPATARVAPGSNQSVTVRTADENGAGVAAVVGVSVTDRGALAMGDEPRVGLLDQALLFADVERGDDLGDFFVGGEHTARNVDLLLGTRGWRRFVWQNDDGAKQRLAQHGPWAAGLLARESFSQTPQVASSLPTMRAHVASLRSSVDANQRTMPGMLGLIAALLAFAMFVELGAFWVRRLGRSVELQVMGGVTFACVALCAGATLMPWSYYALHKVTDRADDVFGTAGQVVRQRGIGGQGAGPDAAWNADWQTAAVDVASPVAPELITVGLPAGAPGLPVIDLDGFGNGLEWRGGWIKDAGLGDPIQGLFYLGAGGWDDRLMQSGGFILPMRVNTLNNAAYPANYVREYAHRRRGDAQRADFTETVYWHPLLLTDNLGQAQFHFDVSDAVTTWIVRADAHGAGRVGQGEARFDSVLPFHLEAKLPTEITVGDHLQLPIAISLADGDGTSADLRASIQGPLAIEGAAQTRVALTDGRGRHLLAVTANEDTGDATLHIAGDASRFQDQVEQKIRVVPRGFPHRRSWGGSVGDGAPASFVVPIPTDAVRGSGHATLKVFPSPLASLAEGLQGLLQEPRGCFEQASSSNYPNTLVLSYLQATGDNLPAIAARARSLLPTGYQKIVGYECTKHGFEWFGHDPGHEALSAYGLLEFSDMAAVYGVDPTMVDRTRAWLLSRRDGRGGYLHPDGSHSFGRAPASVTDPYITYALLYSGTPASDLRPELDAIAARIAATADAYELAVSACALEVAKRPEAATARQRLATLQQDSGALRGTTTSITSSGGDDLAVETTAFAVTAWLPDAAFTGQARRAVEYLQTRKTGNGTFGATQATIMALRALTAYAQASRVMQAAGTVRVFAGATLLAERAFAAGAAEAVAFELWPQLHVGDNALRLEVQGGGGALPWACDLAYHSDQPADDPNGAVAVRTRLSAATVEEGRTVSLEIDVDNRTDQGQPMTLAIVGLPAGVELPTNVLEDRRKAGAFDLWELNGRELALYWRGLAPKANQHVALDLLARIPGSSTGPASRAYLYYTPAAKRWAAPLQVTITAAR